jgi:hypothetical protein
MPRGQYQRGGGAATGTALALEKVTAENVPQSQRSLLPR